MYDDTIKILEIVQFTVRKKADIDNCGSSESLDENILFGFQTEVGLLTVLQYHILGIHS